MQGIELIALTGDDKDTGERKPIVPEPLLEGNTVLYILGAAAVLWLLYTSTRRGL
jgi:hypothetical protein